MDTAPISDAELLLVVSDMETWWNRGAAATGEAQILGAKIKAHLESRVYTEEDDTLETMPDPMLVRLLNVMFSGPTPEICEAARLVLADYNDHLEALKNQAQYLLDQENSNA